MITVPAWLWYVACFFTGAGMRSFYDLWRSATKGWTHRALVYVPPVLLLLGLAFSLWNVWQTHTMMKATGY